MINPNATTNDGENNVGDPICRSVELSGGVLIDAQPSSGGDYPVDGGSFTLEESAYVNFFVEADDSATLTIKDSMGRDALSVHGEIDDWHETGRENHWNNYESQFLEAGEYSISGVVSNIDMHPYEKDNRVYCRCKVEALYFNPPIYTPDEEPCTPCGCDDDGDADHDPVESIPGSVDDDCPDKAEVVDAEPEDAAPRSISSAAGRPLGLRCKSPWAWVARVDGAEITLVSPSGYSLAFEAERGSAVARPSGFSQKHDYRVMLMNADGTPCLSGSPASLALVEPSGRTTCFSVDTGRVTSITSAAGRVQSAEQRDAEVQRIYDADGRLLSSYSAAQGLMQTHSRPDGALALEWFAPSQVSLAPDGSYITSGTPYKTALYSRSEQDGVTTTTVIRQQRGLPPSTITRSVEGNTVTITKGEGDAAIIRTYETNSVFGGMIERIESVRSAQDAEPISCTRELIMPSNGGWLTLSSTEGFNTPLARTTRFEYNDDFRLARVFRPDGGFTEYTYDDEQRILTRSEPWGEDRVKRTSYVYDAHSPRIYDNRPVCESTDYELPGGSFVNLLRVDYSYEDTPQVQRTVTKSYAAGVDEPQVSVEESFGSVPAYAYAAGKLKFSRAVNGVQTVHSYEATTEHGALHKHTAITQADAGLVAGQSRKTEEFIAANDTTTFTQESVWDGEAWLLLSTAEYEYDEQRRLVKATRGNGRVSTKEWMCCGVLREVNEDGVLTTHAYNTALQHLGTTRNAVMDGEVEITPETLTEIVPDALGRAVTSRREIGPMLTESHTAYDALGRIIRETDPLGRVTTTEYSEDGLTSTVTTPTGATLTTTRHRDGSIASLSGSGQREMHYAYDISNNRLRTTVTSAEGNILSQTLTDGFGQTVVETSPSTMGYIYTRSEYNSLGQLVRQHRDTGAYTTPMAPTLYEYDAMGNQVRKTLALSDSPSPLNSPVLESAFSVQQLEDGVYSVTTSTRYDAHGEPLTGTLKQLISQLPDAPESKTISIDERGNESTQWTEFGTGAERLSYTILPTSNIMAVQRSVDGFVTSSTDHAGNSASFARHYGRALTLISTDGRGNTSATVSDPLGRTISQADAAGNTTTTEYCSDCDLPAKVTDALGNTTCYAYDARGRKTAEWGSAIQPACFAYDDADRLSSLTTFRAAGETIDSDPRNRTDGDTTAWQYHDASGLELRKTYADGSHVDKTYDAFNRIASETDARDVVKIFSYEPLRGLLLSAMYSDGTTLREFAYDHLGRLTHVSDDAGSRSISYNAFGELEVNSLLADGVTHSITEQRDNLGRSTGYIYIKDASVQQIVSTGYAADGRISSAGFEHWGEMKLFSFRYLDGSHLPVSLSMPNNMSLSLAYEPQRDLLTQMSYHRGSTLVAQRTYAYDALGRPTLRDTARNGGVMHDSFTHNSRSELTSAQVNGAAYSYAYDNIGNRESAQEAEEVTQYEANALNQYTAVGDFAPEFDLAGNQTLVKTATGIWRVSYNAENRPTRFESVDGDTVVECAYDYMGRRATKKVTINGEVTLHQRYIYRGYLQIAACDLLRSWQPALWYILWDPTQATATRPLAIQKDGTWYTYGWDLTKNICEIYDPNGFIRTSYTYSPYGAVTANGDATQPIQWSSEFNDAELGLVYYNYRHYNPTCSLWLSRDPIGEKGGLHIYISKGMPMCYPDYLGLKMPPDENQQNSEELSCEEKLKMKIQKLQNIINKYSSSSEPNCSKNDGCTLITILVEVGDPCADDEIEQEIGHTAIGIGNEFHDLGPSERVDERGYAKGTAPHWKIDEKPAKYLDQVIKNIDSLAEYPVVSIEFCACQKKTQKAKNYWSNPYNRPYWFLGLNCSTAVWESIGISYWFNRAPERLLDDDSMISQIKSDCDLSGQTRPYMKLIKRTLRQE